MLMGYLCKANCRACGKEFEAAIGGGRRFEELRCDVCGASKAIEHDRVREPLRKYQQGLEALDSDFSDTEFDRLLGVYHQAVEAAAEPCSCGGRFRFGAAVRCPACRSADIELGKPHRLYD